MPKRLLPLVTNQVYHVFNKSIDDIPLFHGKKGYKRFIQTIDYYRFQFNGVKLSTFLRLSIENKINHEEVMTGKDVLVDILCFCLMPNHFHLLMKQRSDNGISKFMSKILNSYTRFYNTRNDRAGQLFLNQFKCVLITNDEQLTHVSRYIHLNPYTSYIVRSYEELENYPWSSFREYTSNGEYGFCKKDLILKLFKFKDSYRKFVFDQADYQRKLKSIKHLSLD